MKIMKNKLLITTISLLLFSLSFASLKITTTKENNYGSVVVSKIIKVYDGDTFRCDIKDYPPIVGQNMPIRINGIDCPEMREENKEIKLLAVKAKYLTARELENGKIIELKNMKRGKYFRIVADVVIDGNDLGSMLIREGLARPYDGGKKVDWNLKKIAPSRDIHDWAYIASKNSLVFHSVGCSHAGEISKDNMIRFDSRLEAVESGRRGCRLCEP